MVYLFKKIKNGKICWYLGESKRENGKVRRTWQKYLGTAENVGEALKHGVFPKETDVLEFGLCAALLKIDSEIKFKDSVDNILKKREQGLSYGEHLLLRILSTLSLNFISLSIFRSAAHSPNSKTSVSFGNTPCFSASPTFSAVPKYFCHVLLTFPFSLLLSPKYQQIFPFFIFLNK